ncbi:MAG: anthranilate synthase component I [Bacteroidetes bacterium]|nr:anthranilate synthase component I [Bacteroidota bacterium]
MISFELFKEASTQYNVIPLTETFLADTHTPVTLYRALRQKGEISFLLESAESNERLGRFSFVGCKPLFTLALRDGVVWINKGGKEERIEGHLIDVIRNLMSTYTQYPLPQLEGFSGGLLGYVGYDTVTQFEKIPLPVRKPYVQPDALFGFFLSVVRYDHRKQLITIIHNVIVKDGITLRQQYEEGRYALEFLKEQVLASHNGPSFFEYEKPKYTEDDERKFEEMVEKAKQYIYDGDIFQVVLSRRMTLKYRGDTFPVYRALRLINPSPYLFYIEFGTITLLGSSPEILVRVTNRHVEVFPIAGTRKRGSTIEDDIKLERELLADEKELAEHHMLIDLGRNDVGRVCTVGSVHVPVNKRIDKYSHVMHIVSEVHGTLRPECTSVDALQACFPAGTVTGAPKVRAMEIISELEEVRRCVYAGAVGYIGFGDSLDMCIAIRTLVATENHIHIQAGAGIVADSRPKREYLETQAKASALLEAVHLAASDFNLTLLRRGVA